MTTSEKVKSNLVVPFEPGVAVFTSGFGTRIDPNTGEPSYHNGVDFAIANGTPLYSPGDGIVKSSWLDSGASGNAIIIDHPPFDSSGNAKFRTSFSHLSKRLVNKGQAVKKGELIGLSGGIAGATGSGSSTGPHLHFTVRALNSDGSLQSVDPIQSMKITHAIPVKSTIQSKYGLEIKKNTINWKIPLIAVGGTLSILSIYVIYSKQKRR